MYAHKRDVIQKYLFHGQFTSMHSPASHSGIIYTAPFPKHRGNIFGTSRYFIVITALQGHVFKWKLAYEKSLPRRRYAYSQIEFTGGSDEIWVLCVIFYGRSEQRG